MTVKRWLADLGWRIARYRLVGAQLPIRSGIVVGGPHTSMWDFVAFLGVSWSQGDPMKVLVKKQMFKGPLAALLRALGAIEVDREKPGHVVEQLLAAISRGETFQLVFAPKGTRSPQPYWKSGFYRIAMAGHLPVTLASIDGIKREVEIGPTLELTSDPAADMTKVRAFYADKAGVHPELRSEPRLREEERPTRREPRSTLS